MEKLLRLPEVVDLTDCRRTRFGFWRHQGLGPRSARLGRRVVYREREVVDWIGQQFEEA